MSKGIVMEMTDKHVIVMTPKGEFIKVSRKKRCCQIGEEIQFSAPAYRWNSSSMRLTSALSAAVLLGVVVFSAFGVFGGGSPAVAAYVTLDINPSVELAVDADEDVLHARGINEDGKKLLESLDYKGEKLDNVTEQLMEKVEQKGFLASDETDVVITSTVVDEKQDLDEKAMIKKIELKVQKVIKLKHVEKGNAIQVVAFSAPPEVRREAVSKGVSTGKLTVQLLVGKSKGEWIPIEELKTQSIKELADEAGGLNQFIHSKKPVTKEKLKKLLDLSKDDKAVITAPIDDKKPDTSKTGSAKEDVKGNTKGNGKGKGKDSKQNNGDDDDDGKKNEKANWNRSHGNTTNNNGSKPGNRSDGEGQKQRENHDHDHDEDDEDEDYEDDDDITGRLKQETDKVVPDISGLHKRSDRDRNSGNRKGSEHNRDRTKRNVSNEKETTR